MSPSKEFFLNDIMALFPAFPCGCFSHFPSSASSVRICCLPFPLTDFFESLSSDSYFQALLVVGYFQVPESLSLLRDFLIFEQGGGVWGCFCPAANHLPWARNTEGGPVRSPALHPVAPMHTRRRPMERAYRWTQTPSLPGPSLFRLPGQPTLDLQRFVEMSSGFSLPFCTQPGLLPCFAPVSQATPPWIQTSAWAYDLDSLKSSRKVRMLSLSCVNLGAVPCRPSLCPTVQTSLSNTTWAFSFQRKKKGGKALRRVNDSPLSQASDIIKDYHEETCNAGIHKCQ